MRATVFETDKDVMVEGKTLKAGRLFILYHSYRHYLDHNL